jgi:transcription-repair coupling factor (superfamily II helicase)
VGRGDDLYLSLSDWTKAVEARTLSAATRDAAKDIALPSLAGATRPTAAFAKVLRAELKAGRRIVLAGPTLPLRRLVREASAVADRAVRLIDGWAEVASAKPGEVLALQAPLGAGFHADGATVIAAADLYGPQATSCRCARSICAPATSRSTATAACASSRAWSRSLRSATGRRRKPCACGSPTTPS